MAMRQTLAGLDMHDSGLRRRDPDACRKHHGWRAGSKT